MNFCIYMKMIFFSKSKDEPLENDWSITSRDGRLRTKKCNYWEVCASFWNFWNIFHWFILKFGYSLSKVIIQEFQFELLSNIQSVLPCWPVASNMFQILCWWGTSASKLPLCALHLNWDSIERRGAGSWSSLRRAVSFISFFYSYEDVQ